MPVSIIAKLLGWTGLPQWALEMAIIGLLLGGIWYWGFHTERTIVKERVVQQQIQVEHRVIETDHSHDQELADLRAYRATHPVQPVRLCIDHVPPRSTEGQPGAPAADVQPVPSGDPGVRPPPAGPDIEPMLELLTDRADEVSAGLRRRQTLEP